MPLTRLLKAPTFIGTPVRVGVNVVEPEDVVISGVAADEVSKGRIVFVLNVGKVAPLMILAFSEEVLRSYLGLSIPASETLMGTLARFVVLVAQNDMVADGLDGEKTTSLGETLKSAALASGTTLMISTEVSPSTLMVWL